MNPYVAPVGRPAAVTHRYANVSRRYVITARATDEDGTYASNRLTVRAVRAAVSNKDWSAALMTESVVASPQKKYSL